MKTKYFLRGLGVGIIIATVLLFGLYSYEMSNSKIAERARELGMVYSKEETSLVAERDTEDDSSKEMTSGVEETTTENESATEQETTMEATEIVVNISSGMSSIAVCEMLAEYGIVDDAQAFDRYLMEQNTQKYIQDGEYTFTLGMSYEEIASIITR